MDFQAIQSQTAFNLIHRVQFECFKFHLVSISTKLKNRMKCSMRKFKNS